MYTLVIGNKNYSSWSLRAWLFLRESEIAFDEIRVPLFTGDWRQRLARYTPAGRVPVLLDGDLAVWDTWAIFEYVREQRPGSVGWPADRSARVVARSVAAEMHSGFLALRDELPMNIRRRAPRELASLSASARAQIERIEQIWSESRDAYRDQGPWLFGEFSIADVMFAPVALRFVTYSVPLTDPAAEFVTAVQSLASINEWARAAEAETERLAFIDDLVPAGEAPLTLG